jgi:AcrR family transcriptional regulator
MTRAADPERKPALLEQIVDYLTDNTLSGLTFRGLATALGVSSFTLVYHFGTREDLVRDIIGAIATRQRGFEPVFHAENVTLDSYLAGLRATFEVTLEPRNRALQRLEFEAQMLEAATRAHDHTRMANDDLHSRARDALVALGLPDEEAELESQLLLDTFYGIQVELIVTDDIDRVTRAFDRALEYHRQQISSLVTRG